MQSLVIVGATGKVGAALVNGLWPYLAPIDCPLERVRLYASARSEGEQVFVPFHRVRVEAGYGMMFHSFDHVVFATPREVTTSFLPRALAAGCKTIVDLSGAPIEGESWCPEMMSDGELRAYDGVFNVVNDGELDDVIAQVVSVLAARAQLRRASTRELRVFRKRAGPPRPADGNKLRRATRIAPLPIWNA